VTVDVDQATVTPVDEIDDINIKEVDKDAVENLLVSGAAVDEVSMKRVSDAATELSDDKKNSPVESSDKGEGGDEDPGAATVEIDMTSDPEALKEAEKFVEDGLPKYEKDEEVCDDLEVSDPSVLRPLPMYALANRIKKFIFKQGFVVGFMAGKVVAKPVEKSDEKMKSANKKIRLMKMVIKVMAECLEMRCRGNSTDAVKQMIETALQEVFSKPEGVKADVSLAFSVGDLKKIPMLKEIKEHMNEES